MAKPYNPVVFEDSRGNIISNDPNYKAFEQLRSAGLLPNAEDDTRSHGVDDSDDEVETGDNEPGVEDYTSVKGKDLAELAQERGINLKNEDGSAKKAGEVREALMEQDREAAAADSGNEE